MLKLKLTAIKEETLKTSLSMTSVDLGRLVGILQTKTKIALIPKAMTNSDKNRI